MENVPRARTRPRVSRPPLLPSSQPLSPRPKVFLADHSDAAPALPIQRPPRLFLARPAASPHLLDALRLARRAIPDELRPSDSPQPHHAIARSPHGQDAVCAVEAPRK